MPHARFEISEQRDIASSCRRRLTTMPYWRDRCCGRAAHARAPEAMQHLVTVVVQCVEIAALFYFIILNSLYLVFSVFAYGVLVRHRRRWTPRHLGAIMRSPATPAVSIVVPAYNERTGIVDTVRSLLMLNYPQFEVIVVNDGSTDDTLTVLRETFGLVEAPCNHASEVATQPVRAIYRSLAIREIVVIDKANGGKADATNAGLNAAQFPLMCLIDADSVLGGARLDAGRVAIPRKPDDGGRRRNRAHR